MKNTVGIILLSFFSVSAFADYPSSPLRICRDPKKPNHFTLVKLGSKKGSAVYNGEVVTTHGPSSLATAGMSRVKQKGNLLIFKNENRTMTYQYDLEKEEFTYLSDYPEYKHTVFCEQAPNGINITAKN